MFLQRLTRSLAAPVVALVGLASANAATEAVRVTTWNLQWFPNGSSKVATVEEQTKRINAAADIIRPLDPDILLLQEVQDYDACARLAEAIRPNTYQVAICSAFKEPGQGLAPQQVAILSKEPAQAAWSEPWATMEGVDPPRGFAFAWIKVRTAHVGVYCVHLKSNLIRHGDKEAETTKNIRKREVAADQLLKHMQTVIAPAMPIVKSVVIGGDFNTNRDQPAFAAETTLKKLTQAGFMDWTEGLPLAQRVTHPKSGGYPDATFDYLLGKNVSSRSQSISVSEASDHYAVTCEFSVPGTGENPPEVGGHVVVTRDTTITIPYGTTTIRAGTRVKVVSRDGDQLRIDYLGGTYSVPVSNMSFAPADEFPTPTATPAPTPPALIAKTLSGPSARAVAVSAPRPEYPYEARRSKIVGSGVCAMTVDPGSGAVTNAEMAQSTGSSILDNAATSAFRRWRFKPGEVSKVRMPITFTMSGAQY